MKRTQSSVTTNGTVQEQSNTLPRCRSTVIRASAPADFGQILKFLSDKHEQNVRGLQLGLLVTASARTTTATSPSMGLQQLQPRDAAAPRPPRLQPASHDRS